MKDYKNGKYFIDFSDKIGKGTSGRIFRCYDYERPYYKLCVKI